MVPLKKIADAIKAVLWNTHIRLTSGRYLVSGRQDTDIDTAVQLTNSFTLYTNAVFPFKR
jgi:hypothetical protein